jgi:hypothetical protein
VISTVLLKALYREAMIVGRGGALNRITRELLMETGRLQILDARPARGESEPSCAA